MSGVKYNKDKCQEELFSPIALEIASWVMTYGGVDYAPENWREGLSWKEVLGASSRHLTAIKRGEDLDPKTGLPHAAHLLCEAMFLVEFYVTGAGTDDRYKFEPGAIERLSEMRDAVQDKIRALRDSKAVHSVGRGTTPIRMSGPHPWPSDPNITSIELNPKLDQCDSVAPGHALCSIATPCEEHGCSSLDCRCP